MATKRRKEADESALPPGWGVDKRGTRYYNVIEPESRRLLYRVGYYHDPDPRNPQGFSRWVDFLPVFRRQVEKGQWASLVFDSFTFANISARKWSEYDINEGGRDNRQNYGYSTDQMEEAACLGLPHLPCNVALLMHVSQTKVEAEGTMVRAPLAPGRLLNMVGGAWPELYRVYVEHLEDGTKVRRLQTDSTNKWQAGTTIDAPDDVRVYRNDPTKTWERLWSNYWDTQRPAWHGILYGVPHIGKSTAACMLPTPCYVALFDGVGKDAAYRRRGIIGDPDEEVA